MKWCNYIVISKNKQIIKIVSKCLTLLSIMEKQIKTALKCHLTPDRLRKQRQQKKEINAEREALIHIFEGVQSDTIII